MCPRRATSSAPKIDGGHVLYHYLQKDLLKNDIWLFQMLTARLIVSLGIWLPIELYSRMPIVIPYAVRDPKCRGDRARGLPDEWGKPDSSGYFRDDNSLVKGIPKSLVVRNPDNPLYDGRRIGRGFVASHVWRELNDGSLASRNPSTYAFVPNLVWLPSQVSKLTDREGSFVQGYLQALSLKLYKGVPVPDQLQAVVEKSWSKLPMPQGIPPQGLPDASDLNFFESSPAFLQRRVEKIFSVVRAITSVLEGEAISGGVIASRYKEGLPDVDSSALTSIGKGLAAYLDAIRLDP